MWRLLFVEARVRPHSTHTPKSGILLISSWKLNKFEKRRSICWNDIAFEVRRWPILCTSYWHLLCSRKKMSIFKL